MNAKTRARRNFWIQTVVVALIVVLLIAAYIRSATKPLAAEDLSIHAGDMRSLCAAGVEFSNQFEAGNLTEVFFTDQLELMHDKVTSIRKTLDDSKAEPEIQGELESARRAAAELDTAFDKLTVDPHGPQSTRDELKKIVTPLGQLENKLKQEAEQ